MRFFIVFILFVFCSHSKIEAQTYEISYSENKLEFYASLGFWTSVQMADLLRKPEVLDDFDDIDPENIWRLDRGALNQNAPGADRLSDWLLYASIGSPLLFTFADDKLRGQAKQITQLALQGYLIENGLNQFAKMYAERPRPYVYRKGIAILDEPISKNSTKSFFSGHSSSAAYFSFFAAKVYHDLHPDNPWRYAVWGGAGVLAGATGLQRYRAGKHFMTDIAVGWLVGGGLGILIPELYRIDSPWKLGAGRRGVKVTFRID